jgi:hypothetical protein
MADILRYKEGGVTVTVDGDIREAIERIIDETGGVVLERIETDVNRVHAVAVKRWPVKSGRSRDGLKTAYTFDRSQSRIEGGVLALVPYAVYIKTWRNGLRGAHVWTVLVRKPIVNVKKRLRQELGDVILTGGKRRARGGTPRGG